MRDRSPPRNRREHIAHLAARLMAEDGIADFDHAKRKAARLAGSLGSRDRLPSNEEVEVALRAYLQLYQADEHAARIGHLRSKALNMMRLLEAFNPRLCGPVLTGNAGRYSNIELLLFADSAKDVELFLINRGLQYRLGERKVYVGDVPTTVPTYLIVTDDADFEISVLSQPDLKSSIRYSENGRPQQHVGLKYVSRMLDEATDVLTVRS